jgi:DNA-binding transcriptional ArsR family regulator
MASPHAPEAVLCEVEAHPARPRHTYAEDHLEQAAAIFRAIGDLERLRLLAFLVDGEACVTDLASAMKVGLSTISQRLKVLRAEDLIVRRRVGKHIFYSLVDQHIVGLVRNALDHASTEHAARSPSDPDE